MSRFVRPAALGAAVLGVALGCYGLLSPSAPDTAGNSATPASPPAGNHLFADAGLGAGEDAPQSTPQTLGAGPTAALEHAIFVDGSLRGAELDGGWGRWTGSELLPSRDLRRRFDQLLTTVGELNLGQLREIVGAQAHQDLGPEGSTAVLAMWDRYLKLQQHRFELQVDPQRPEQWRLVLAEHQRVRREHLGFAWADAFYREEEESLRAMSEAPKADPVNAANASATPPIILAPNNEDPAALHQRRVTALGPEAASRLQAEDQAQAAWSTRLSDAQREVQALRNAPELSTTQREQAVKQWVATHFSGSELMRASALLGL